MMPFINLTIRFKSNRSVGVHHKWHQSASLIHSMVAMARQVSAGASCSRGSPTDANTLERQPLGTTRLDRSRPSWPSKQTAIQSPCHHAARHFLISMHAETSLSTVSCAPAKSNEQTHCTGSTSTVCACLLQPFMQHVAFM